VTQKDTMADQTTQEPSDALARFLFFATIAGVAAFALATIFYVLM